MSAKPIIIQNTERDLEKFYDIVTYPEYKTFNDVIVESLDKIFRDITLNGSTSSPLVNTSTLKKVLWQTGETLEVIGSFPSDDTSKWNLNKIVFTSVDGTTFIMKGMFKVSEDQSSIAAGTKISEIEIFSANTLSSFFDTPNVLTKIVTQGNFSYNGEGEFSGTNTLLDRTFNDGWQAKITYDNRFTYTAGDYTNSGSGGFVSLFDPTGVEVFKIDISDYDLGGDDEYDEAYRERFFAGANKISGTKFEDNINSYAGDDFITSGDGEDILIAGDGNDVINAGNGNDLIIGGDGAGNDTYDGGKGIDTAKYTSALASISVNLAKGTATSTDGSDAAGIGSDKLKNIENIIAGDFGDTLTGSKIANSIEGGAGNDTIDGGLGNDTLIGGDGDDKFVFSSKPSTKNIDTIDFQAGIDTIQLSAKLFKALTPGTDFIASGHLVYKSDSGLLSYDADGSGSKAAVAIALIGTGLILMEADFVVA